MVLHDVVVHREIVVLHPIGIVALHEFGKSEIGFSLLERKNRSFTLTPAGEFFYRKSLILTADYERMCSEAAKIANGNKASLKIGYLRCYTGGEFRRALELFSGLYASGKDVAAMTDELCSLSRDLLMLKAAPKSGLSMLTGVCSDQEALALLERFSPTELLRITTLLQQTAAGFQKSANRRVDMELCLIQMCQPQLSLDAKALSARIGRIEEKLASGTLVSAAAVPQKAPPPEDVDDGERPPLPDDADDPIRSAAPEASAQPMRKSRVRGR